MIRRSNGGMGAETRSSEVIEDLSRQVAKKGQRLARLEFRNFVQEIESGGAFDLNVALPPRLSGPVRHAPPADPAVARHQASREAPLEVPLGDIAWTEAPHALPVYGIHCPAMGGREFAVALLRLLGDHHRKPLVRFVFICDTLTPIPLLGRYGFAVHYLGGEPLQDAMSELSARFDIGQVRALDDARQLWRRDDDIGQ